jgi:hypothetical protein
VDGFGIESAGVLTPEEPVDGILIGEGKGTDKDSGITHDANLWAAETMGDAKYPLIDFPSISRNLPPCLKEEKNHRYQ